MKFVKLLVARLPPKTKQCMHIVSQAQNKAQDEEKIDSV